MAVIQREAPDVALRHHLDDRLRRLQASKTTWARLPPADKVALLQRARRLLAAVAGRWVATANEARQIPLDSPWAAEEWYEIFTLARTLQGYADTLARLAAGRMPQPGRVWTRPGGQVVARVFPADLFDWLLFNGLLTEVWMQPGVSAESLPAHMGAFYRQADPPGAVALVLGAGNLNSIPALDALDRLFVHGQVALLKLSPINGYLRPLLETILAPLITPGFLAIVEGDAAAGAYLAAHPGVEAIHLTGGVDTYRAVQEEATAAGRPPRPITAELSGVTPVIVAPGRWTAADIRFQAENIATMKLFNSGYNCISAQLLILPQRWELGAGLVDTIRQVMQAAPPQPAYYPGAGQRQAAAVRACPRAALLGGEVPRTLIPDLNTAAASAHCRQTEFFGPVLAVTTLPGDTPAAFLRNAVDYCHQSVQGNLGVDLIASPDAPPAAVEAAVAELRYGAIGVNAWCGVAYRLAQNPWGAYQDPAATEIGSGRGVVHNALLFDRPQKCVVRGRFRPFPRSWRHGDPAFLPKPPWFITHRQRLDAARRVAGFTLQPAYGYLPGIFAAALRG